MNAYTVSRLAFDAGVSVHIVRDYLLRGLLRPVACTTGGYGLFDDAALQRLCFVRAAFEAGIGLAGVGADAAPAAAPSWGAIATQAPDQRYGYAFDHATREAAERAARTQCERAVGMAANCTSRLANASRRRSTN